MRLDKFLKVSRILKRRTTAKQVADGGRVTVNGRPSKPAHLLKPQDTVTIRFGDKLVAFRVLTVDEKAARKSGLEMYEIVEQTD